MLFEEYRRTMGPKDGVFGGMRALAVNDQDLSRVPGGPRLAKNDSRRAQASSRVRPWRSMTASHFIAWSRAAPFGGSFPARGSPLRAVSLSSDAVPAEARASIGFTRRFETSSQDFSPLAGFSPLLEVFSPAGSIPRLIVTIFPRLRVCRAARSRQGAFFHRASRSPAPIH